MNICTSDDGGCDCCGRTGKLSQFLQFRGELVCVPCRDDMIAKSCCDECDAAGVKLTETEQGYLYCAGCAARDAEDRAERSQYAQSNHQGDC